MPEIDRWPAILFGDDRTVNRNVRALTKKACAAGSWDAVCADLEMKDDDGSQDLLIDACHKFPWVLGMPQHIPADEPRWRFYPIIDALNGEYMKNKISRDAHVRMRIAGMDYLWFTISMLDDSNPDFLPLAALEYRSASCDLLGKFIYWIPELNRLDHRLFWPTAYSKRSHESPEWAATLERARQKPDLDEFEHLLKLTAAMTKPEWAQKALGLACGIGWEWNRDRVYGTYKADVVRLFLDDQVIEPSGSGYKLTDSFIARAHSIA